MLARSVCLSLGLTAFLAITNSPLAHAETEYEVEINSKPTGAKVHLDSRESEPIGDTPLSGTLPEGTYNLIVVLPGFEDSVQTVKVKKSKSKQVFNIELTASKPANVEVKAKKGGSAKGAVIYVDGEKKGQVPETITLPPGAHQIEVKKEGYKTFEQWVEPTNGESVSLSVDLEVDGDGNPGEVKPPDETKPGDNEEKKPDPKNDKPAADEPHPALPMVRVFVGVEFAGRDVSYQDRVTTNQRTFTSKNRPAFRIAAELYPLAANPTLGGLGVGFGYGKALGFDADTPDNRQVSVGLTDWDASLLYKYWIGGKYFVGAHIGYGKQTMTYSVSAVDASLRDQLPEVAYGFIKAGADAGATLKNGITLGFSGELRMVRDAGELGKRYASDTVSGFSVAPYVGYQLAASFEVRLSAIYTKYTHDINSSPGDTYEAGGINDTFLSYQLGGLMSF